MGINFFDAAEQSYPFAGDMEKDLNLKVIARNMAGQEYGDVADILDTLLRPLLSVEAIEKRISVVMDSCSNHDLILKMRKIILETWSGLNNHIKAIQDCRGKHLMEQTVIGTHLKALRVLVDGLWELDGFLREKRKIFESTALNRFYRDFYEEISHERIEEQKYLADHLDSFKNRGEIFLRARMAEGFHLTDVEILDVKERAHKAQSGIFSGFRKDVISDEETYQSAVEFTNRVLLDILERCFPYLQHWQELLADMKKQVVFLAGCGRLWKRLREFSFPCAVPSAGERQAEKLYELSLALQTQQMPITNSVSVPDYRAIVVTGANQGGKSTFLRSLGIAQVMCQAGMYVPAHSYPIHAYRNIFTHFTRREDASLNMGKFEEELRRMSLILKNSGENTLFLLNESFATTTEVTAFQIAMDLAHACVEENITLWMVTHITKFAGEFYREGRKDVLFLSAGRVAEHEKRYVMIEKEPGDTSYGLELYEEIIGGAD